MIDLKKDNESNLKNESTQKNDNKNIVKAQNVKDILGQSADIIFREIYINSDKDLPITLAFVDGMINSKLISDDVLKPLIQECKLSKVKNYKEIIKLIEHGTVYTATVNVRNKIEDLINDILSGFTVLIFDSENKAVTIETKGYEKRDITPPTDEVSLKSAKDCFIEDIRTNTALVRRKIKNPNLIIEQTVVGKQTRTTIAVVYIKGLTNEDLVREVRNRLNNIDTDNALTVGFISNYICDKPFSPFPMEVLTERPDKFCANVVEGYVGIIIDGLPITLIVPGTLNQFMQLPEDYTDHTYVDSFKRALRYILLLVSLTLPSFYIAVTEFNQELIFSKLAFAISTSREGVPFPAFIEVTLMVLAFDILVEAALRLPGTISQTVSIVGGIIIGEAAVQANVASPIVIILVALTGISSFTMPGYSLNNVIRILRYVLIAFASAAGLFGIAIGVLLLLHHLCRLESFGVPYLAPFVGNANRDLKDSVLRLPYSWLKKRPSYLKTTNKKRQE